MESNKPPNGHERHMLFLSHATPEDNSFARWLALQLANEGYPVWCDLTKLLGGEDFWKDIQEAIRKRSIRFLFVLSRSSNTKEGTLQELACAKAVAAQVRSEIRDFIIALKLDDLPYSEVDIEIQRLNHIPFTGSWASGLNQLLKKLADDNVPKDARFNPDSVSSWWRSQSEFSALQGVVDEPEVELSNWYGIERFPGTVWCHNVSRRSTGKLDFDISGLPYPVAKATDLSFLSFAKADELSDFLDKSIYIQSSLEISVSDILVRSHPLSRHVVNMLRQGWESAVEKSGFSVQRAPHVRAGFTLKETRFQMIASSSRVRTASVRIAMSSVMRRNGAYCAIGIMQSAENQNCLLIPISSSADMFYFPTLEQLCGPIRRNLQRPDGTNARVGGTMSGVIVCSPSCRNCAGRIHSLRFRCHRIKRLRFADILIHSSARFLTWENRLLIQSSTIISRTMTKRMTKLRRRK